MLNGRGVAVVTKQTRQFFDFRLGEVGAKNFHTGSINDLFFNGFAIADECMYYGAGVAKRPPIKYVSSYFTGNADNEIVILSSPGTRDEEEIKILAFKTDSGYDLFYLNDEGILLDASATPIQILTFKGEGNAIHVTTSAPLTVGKHYLLSVGQQKLDVLYVISEDNSVYTVAALTGEKVPFYGTINNLSLIRSGTTTLELDYNDVIPIANYNLYIRDSNSFAVDAQGAITTTPTLPTGQTLANLTGKSATVHNNVFAVARDASGNNGILIKLTSENTSSENFLQPYYGKYVYWIRDSSKGLLISTDEGIFNFSVELASTGNEFVLGNYIRVTYRQSADIKPIYFRDYLLFVDAGRRAVMYVGFDRFQVNAIVDTLISAVDLLDEGDRINLIRVLHFNDITTLLSVSDQGVCISGNIQASNSGTGASATLSYSRWFTAYRTKYIDVWRKGEKNDTLLWCGGIDGTGFIGLVSEQPAPLIRKEAENRDAHIDFYTVLSSEKIFGDKPVLTMSVTDNDWSVTLQSPVDFFPIFKDIGVQIRTDTFSIEVVFVEDARTAKGILKFAPQTTFGSSIILKDYKICFTSIVGLSYLYFLNGKQYDVVGESGLRAFMAKSTGTENTLYFAGNFCDNITIGISYNFRILIAPPAFRSRFIASKGNVEVATQTLGYTDPQIFISIFGEVVKKVRSADKRGSYPDIEISRKNLYHEFFKNVHVTVPSGTNTALMVEISCDSVFPLFLSGIAISANVSDL